MVAVQAGTYVDDFAEITHKITLQGIGGMVNMVATGLIPNGKAILITDTDVTIDHFSFSGATVNDGNGAGIRYQGGNLVVANSLFQNNQNGILGGAYPSGTVTIRNSEFDHNGAGDGYTHGIYIGDIAALTIDGSYFHDAVVGHEIKSRAENTIIRNSRVEDGPNGSASYAIDLPNGGAVEISNSIVEKGPNSQNPVLISFGEEGNLHANSALSVLNDNAALRQIRLALLGPGPQCQRDLRHPVGRQLLRRAVEPDPERAGHGHCRPGAGERARARHTRRRSETVRSHRRPSIRPAAAARRSTRAACPPAVTRCSASSIARPARSS